MGRSILLWFLLATSLQVARVEGAALICSKDLNGNGIIEATEKMSCLQGSDETNYCPIGAVDCTASPLTLSGSASAPIPTGVANYIGFSKISVTSGIKSIEFFRWPDQATSQQYACSGNNALYSDLPACTGACTGFCVAVAVTDTSAGKIDLSGAPSTTGAVSGNRITKVVGNGNKLDVYGCKSVTGLSCSSTLMGSVDLSPFTVSGSASAATGLIKAVASGTTIAFDGYSCDESLNCQVVNAGSIQLTWTDYTCPLGNYSCVGVGSGAKCSAQECVDPTLAGTAGGTNPVCGKDLNGDGIVLPPTEFAECKSTPQGQLCGVDAVACNVGCPSTYSYKTSNDRCELSPPDCIDGAFVASKNRCEAPPQWTCDDNKFTRTNDVCDYRTTECSPGYQYNPATVKCEATSVTTSTATPQTSVACKTESFGCTDTASSCCHIDINCNQDSTVTVKYNDCCGNTMTTNLQSAGDFLTPQQISCYGSNIVCAKDGNCALNFYGGACSSCTGSLEATHNFTLNTKVDGYTCSAGVYNQATGQCETTAVTAVPPSCPTGSTLVPNTNICRKPASHFCGDGTTFDNSLPYPSACFSSPCKQHEPEYAISFDSTTDVCWSQRKLTCPTGNNTCMDANAPARDWKCSPTPCATPSDQAGGSVEENADTGSYGNDGATDSDGGCLGQVLFFNGKGGTCRTAGIGTSFFNCCSLDDSSFLIFKKSCSNDEREMNMKKNAGACHYVGEYCKTKWPLVGCVQKARTYCCFNSKMGRILQEYGRPQLKNFGPTPRSEYSSAAPSVNASYNSVPCTATAADLSAADKAANHDPRVGCYYGWSANSSWGGAKNPNCRGFTPEEFEMLDFDRVDFKEMYAEMEQKATQAQQDAQSQMEQKANEKLQQQTP